MKAEDTIMSPEQITGWLDGNPVSTLVAKQAELSFKMGQDDIMRLTHPYFQAIAKDNYEAGINEVVEWVMSHQDGMMAGQDVQEVAGNDCKYGNTSHLLVRWLDWQAKLKEWEIV